MKRAVLYAAIALLVILPAEGQEVPFAQPSPPKPGQSANSSQPSLSNIMAETQLRHIKLWYAGRAANWGLVNYELSQIKDTFDRSATLYVNIPVENVVEVEKPLKSMQDALKEKDFAKFSHGYSQLTAACNNCHAAGRVGFIHIQAPTASPFSDQNFEKP